jgi:ubiquinone biosynthesis protein
MVHGFFQSDPHPGNILVLGEDKIAFIDFGETGTLTKNRLIRLGRLLQGIDEQNTDKAMSALYDLGILNESINLDDFEGEFSDMVERVYSSHIGGIDIDSLRKEILSLTYRYKLVLPSYLMSLMKALVTLDGVGKKLDPHFNISEAIQPVMQQVQDEMTNPKAIYKTLERGYYRDIKPLLALPGNINKLVRVTGEGDLQISHQHELKKHLDSKVTQVANRISASLIIAGGLVSTSLVLLATDHPIAHLNNFLLGTGGIAVLMGLYAFVFSGRQS